MRYRTHIGHARRGSVLSQPTALLGDWGPVDFSPKGPSAAEQAEHQGRTPQPGVPAGPRDTQQPSASGYEYSQETYEGHPNLTPPAPALVQPRRALFPPERQLVASPSYLNLVAPLTPLKQEPTALQKLLEGVGGAFGGNPVDLVSEALHGPQAASQPAAPPRVPAHQQSPPSARHGEDQNPGTAFISSERGVVANPADPLGKKTLGDVTAAQLAHAQRAGTLRVSKKGVLSTPQNRAVVQQLMSAKAAVDASGPDLQSLHQQYPELSLPVLKSYRDAARRTGVPAPLLAGIENAESTYGTSTLPGVHSGQNFAGAAGPFQIGNGTGASGDAWQGLAEELWGGQAAQHSIYNQHDAALAAGQYLAHTYGHATASPSTWQAAAESYNHSQSYAEGVVDTAKEHSALSKLGLPPNPKATEALAVAKKQAVAAGINPTPWNGDVAGGGQDFTWVRADAKGMSDWVESALGTQEGSAKAERWGGRFGLNTVSQPWCANFVSNGLLRRGFSADELPANPNFSGGNGGFETWAEEGKYATNVGTDLSKAKPGDLLAFSEQHIATYVGNGEMVSGNFGDEVEKTPISAESAPLSMIIRPKYKGGKVKVADATVAGTGTTEGVGGVPASGTSAGAVPGASTATGTSVLAAGQAPFAGQVPITAPGYTANNLAAPNVEPGTTEGEELLRALTQPGAGAVLQ